MSQIEITTIERKVEQTRIEIKKCGFIEDELLRKALISELEIRLIELLRQEKEIKDSAWKDTIRIRIFGEKVDNGRIPARTLIAILNGFTQLADSIANAVLNTPSEKGRIPLYVQNSVDFQVVGMFAGSFGIILERPEETNTLITTFSKTDVVLSEVFGILEANGNVDLLLNTIISSGIRVIANYKSWLTCVEENEVNIELAWENRIAENRVIIVDAKESTAVISALDGIEDIKDVEVDITGMLTGINIRHNRFEITVEGLGVIKGNGKFETLISVSELMGQEIKATLIKSTTYSKAKTEKIAWYLVSATTKS